MGGVISKFEYLAYGIAIAYVVYLIATMNVFKRKG